MKAICRVWKPTTAFKGKKQDNYLLRRFYKVLQYLQACAARKRDNSDLMWNTSKALGDLMT